jgi:histidinol-phosphate aminotransferase
MRRAVTDRTRVVFVATPNNPVGTAVGAADLLAFVRSLPPRVVCVVDEAYAEYHEGGADLRVLMAEGRPVIGLRTFSKIHGLAALRVGYGYAPAGIAALLQRVRQPFNVNAIAQAAALAALDDDDFVRRSIAANREGMARLEAGLSARGVEFVPSAANFILMRVGDGAAVSGALLRRGVIVRTLGPYDMPEWIRVTVGTAAQNARFLEALSAARAVPAA